MSNSGNALKNEPIRILDAASLTTSYQDLGGPLEHRAFRLTYFNTTQGDVTFKRVSDGSQDSKRQPSQTGRVEDDKTNDGVEVADTQFQVKWSDSAPAVLTGNVWIEVEYV